MKNVPMKNRREFITAAAALTLSTKLYAVNHDLLQLKRQMPAGSPTAGVALAVSTTRTVTIPRNFVGLSYESQQLADPHFFSPKNAQLIAQFKALSPQGVLRIGGNTSDFSWWQPTPETARPSRSSSVFFAGEPAPGFSYPITPVAIDNLRKFLDDANWTCLYGINFGNNTPELAADEAAYVAGKLGPRLEYFQLGNEVDQFSRHIRDPKTWSPDAYFAEWLPMARAILARVPNAQFGAPDIAGNLDWLTAFAANIAKTDNPPKIAAITHHHYVGGPPNSPDMTIPRILAGPAADPAVDKAIAVGTAAAAQLHTALRMTEGNTCYSGGKPGVSDVFASSLWAADYLLYLASAGYAGVNLHGGDALPVADSLGGSLPGEALMKNSDESHPRPLYTPIASINGIYTAEPVFYGMLFAQQFAGATMLDVAFNPTFTPVNEPAGSTARVNATAYAAIRPDGKIIIAVINKDLTNDIVVHITGAYPSSILHLTASAPDATGVTFANATVTLNGQWKPRPSAAFIYLGHNAPVHVPRASAALFVCH
ncbi:MAG TPA: hypothetical protein VNU94_05065 [Acidobacteriaceae bacterium]|nr:hypothetical protein [Acidobacteriaceae bacterium]